MKMKERITDFDPVAYLDNDEVIAEYLTAVLEEDDPNLLLTALANVAKARGMTQIAKDTGLGRESLYKALAPGAKPRFDTVLKILRSLKVNLTAIPAASAAKKRRTRAA